MKKMNSEQEVVTRHIEKMGPGDRVIISGSAGSGKTFAIARSVANRKALFLAPTHPARAVLEAELGSSGQRVMTIHSFIGWRGYRDEGLVRRDRYRPAREASFRSKSKGQLSTCPFSEAEIIIVDECSMVGAFLFAAIEEYADELGLPVVYSGDPYQLPPVNDREVIWDQGFETLTLKESMRFSKDSEIFRVSDALRRMIASDPDSELRVFEGGADLVVTPGTQWMQDLRADYANSASCLAVSSLNDMLQRLRGKVRGLSHDRLAVGDLVMSKKTDERFLNGEQFTIRQITSDTCELHNVPPCVVGTGTLEISGQTMTFAETDTNAFIVERGSKEAISRRVRDLYDEDRLEH
ncbi:AAA family ATPase, partial [Salipiger bermudensis]|uniref:AAA family ATPase n=1 Tax=Salipiger bermudensis TaxID=344736 RepID=UPI001C99950E